jgi:hypothetical protein
MNNPNRNRFSRVARASSVSDSVTIAKGKKNLILLGCDVHQAVKHEERLPFLTAIIGQRGNLLPPTVLSAIAPKNLPTNLLWLHRDLT